MPQQFLKLNNTIYSKVFYYYLDLYYFEVNSWYDLCVRKFSLSLRPNLIINNNHCYLRFFFVPR